MDLSTKYVKMCDCPEVQEQWEPEIGDWYYRSGESINLVKGKAFKIHYLDWKSHPQHEVCSKIYQEHTWLPKQDQIRAMIFGKKGKKHTFVKMDNFYDWCTWNPSYETMEQLWLTFYMWRKQSLQWLDGEWRK